MNIPKFWSKATAQATSAEGKPLEFTCWRSSDVSEADAHESALAAARRLIEAFLDQRELTHYDYGHAPLREEITNTLHDAQGNRVALVTRNRSGVLVLNAERVMFVDVDFPRTTAGAAARHFFARLFGRPSTPPETQHEDQARARIEEFVAARPEWNLRLYRTRAGLRGIVTHALFQPQSDASLDALQQMGSDALYVRLCQAQDCFRARLTPKPWRCGHHNNRVRFPVENDAAAQEFAQWVADYDALHRRFATCRFLAEIGSGRVHPEAQQIIDLHDFVTRCQDSLDLA
jgi:hypothetical protein